LRILEMDVAIGYFLSLRFMAYLTGLFELGRICTGYYNTLYNKLRKNATWFL